jgi:hypothetical protein
MLAAPYLQEVFQIIAKVLLGVLQDRLRTELHRHAKVVPIFHLRNVQLEIFFQTSQVLGNVRQGVHGRRQRLLEHGILGEKGGIGKLSRDGRESSSGKEIRVQGLVGLALDRAFLQDLGRGRFGFVLKRLARQ